ncbi:MAG: hypothetical protein AAB407_01690 [Patescibacteria group bacterium]
MKARDISAFFLGVLLTLCVVLFRTDGNEQVQIWGLQWDTFVQDGKAVQVPVLSYNEEAFAVLDTPHGLVTSNIQYLPLPLEEQHFGINRLSGEFHVLNPKVDSIMLVREYPPYTEATEFYRATISPLGGNIALTPVLPARY